MTEAPENTAPSLTRQDIEKRLDRLLWMVAAQAFETDLAAIRKLPREECLLSFNSVTLLEFVMALEVEFALEVDDEHLSIAPTLSFDRWVDYLEKRIQA